MYRWRLAPIEKLVIKLFLFISAIFIGMYMSEKINENKKEQTYNKVTHHDFR